MRLLVRLRLRLLRLLHLLLRLLHLLLRCGLGGWRRRRLLRWQLIVGVRLAEPSEQIRCWKGRRWQSTRRLRLLKQRLLKRRLLKRRWRRVRRI